MNVHTGASAVTVYVAAGASGWPFILPGGWGCRHANRHPHHRTTRLWSVVLPQIVDCHTDVSPWRVWVGGLFQTE